jgi:hypothetical protein
VTGPTVPTSGNNNIIGVVTGTSTAPCPTGTTLIGGGALTTNAPDGHGEGAVFLSRPQGGTSTTTWEAVGITIASESAGEHIAITAYAICTP